MEVGFWKPFYIVFIFSFRNLKNIFWFEKPKKKIDYETKLFFKNEKQKQKTEN